MIYPLDLLLLLFLVIIAIVVVNLKDLLGAIVLLSCYSLIMALTWLEMNSPDVAFTEAAVGAGVTTFLFIAALSKTVSREGSNHGLGMLRYISIISLLLLGIIFIYVVDDMPEFGNPKNPANLHIVPRYIEKSEEETGVPNIVTAILANYRGYDTLGETTVIFTAGISVMILFKRWRNG